MKQEYTAYVREIDGKQFYFIKRFIVIPELQNIHPVLAGYGMHRQFDKACDIAGVINAEEKKHLYAAIQQQQVSQAKVISIDFKQPATGKKIS